jgi:hypothetical protein
MTSPKKDADGWVLDSEADISWLLSGLLDGNKIDLPDA